MLQSAGRAVQRIELTKWCFLLRHELPSSGGNAFYDFVPYRFGPFSFSLYQEADKLQQNGYLDFPDDNSWVLRADCRSVPAPPKDVQADVQKVLDRFGEMPLDSLIRYVYRQFPAYTVNSERQKLASRPTTQPAVFTAGYEGLSVDAFLNLLVETGIERLIDVRMNPVARRFGFHKSTLSRLLGHLGIEYLHVPELGIASSSRQDLNAYEDYQKLFASYEATTLESESAAIERVSRLISERPSVLVCMEADPKYCHRSRLANRVAEITHLPLAHLQAQA
jgi:uncharacterized protein (DUF488 family)